MINSTKTTYLPVWALNNPYLPILAPRFFNQIKSCDWSDLPRRVVRMFSEVERKYSNEAETQVLGEKLLSLLNDGAFFPNSPVMMNTECRSSANLFACHVLAPPLGSSSMEIASKIHDGCGGIGYDLTSVEDPVAMTMFIEEQTAILNPSRKRKAHSAVTLHVNHEMIASFVGMSHALEITHTNVELDRRFFSALEQNDQNALKIWDAICSSIYTTGRPAIVFGEHKSLKAPNGERLILNVCGESLLRENESALIGSISISRFITNGLFSEERFKEAVALAVRCLDNLHDIQNHASQEVAERCLESRKIGLSIMGFADGLLLMGIRYGSQESLDFSTRVMSLLQSTVRATSEDLALTRGGCNPALLPAGTPLRRNASLMAIAANGTLSLLANVTGGIEPVFSFVLRQTVEGQVMHQMQPTLRCILLEHGLSETVISEITENLVNGAAPKDIDLIPVSIQNIMVCAHDLSPSDHIRLQSTFQSFIDGGISKTINMSSSSNASDIAAAILNARASGCVGISLYRDGSIINQPLQMATSTESTPAGVVA